MELDLPHRRARRAFRRRQERNRRWRRFWLVSWLGPLFGWHAKRAICGPPIQERRLLENLD